MREGNSRGNWDVQEPTEWAPSLLYVEDQETILSDGIHHLHLEIQIRFYQGFLVEVFLGTSTSGLIHVFFFERLEHLISFLEPAERRLVKNVDEGSSHEAAYHEALVHLALLAHSNLKRVVIIGGGEGATLREVLKHNTIEEAYMVEIDEMMVNVSKNYIPEWSDCSDLVGSPSWCVEDVRAHVYYEDALAWFADRYSYDRDADLLMDVIIMDALDPEYEIPFSKALYSNLTFMQNFYNSLSDDGILVMQLGESPKTEGADETHSQYRNRAATIRLLDKVGFQSIHTYEESHCGFNNAWLYMIGFKSYSTRMRWYANAAEIDLDIHKRLV